MEVLRKYLVYLRLRRAVVHRPPRSSGLPTFSNQPSRNSHNSHSQWSSQSVHSVLVVHHINQSSRVTFSGNNFTDFGLQYIELCIKTFGSTIL